MFSDNDLAVVTINMYVDCFQRLDVAYCFQRHLYPNNLGLEVGAVIDRQTDTPIKIESSELYKDL